MPITVPTVGQTTWGAPLNAAVASLGQSGFDPVDLGYKVWNFPNYQTSLVTGTALTSGTVVMMRMPRLVQAESLTKVAVHCGIVASGLTAGQCFGSIYNLAGTRLAVSADLSGSFTSIGVHEVLMTSTVNAAAGDDLVAALLFNGTTPPGISCCSSTSTTAANGLLSNATALFANGPTAQTSMPASITMSGRTPSAFARWAAMG